MKGVVAVFLGVAVLVPSARVRAGETPTDVESDHVNAADDGGPRTFGVLVQPLSMAAGWFGAEVDGACGQNVALTLGADGRWFAGFRALRASVGASFYPQGFPFHGLYVRSFVDYGRGETTSGTGSEVGVGATVGYAWTWPVGASVRLGGGAAYSMRFARDAAPSFAPGGVAPAVDADLGWVF